MNLNADFSQRAAVHAASLEWVASPVAGVERKMLDRVGDEVARATSFVRYAPRSRFTEHTHGGGEEFLVLDGVFQDEHGDFPRGSYIRNPPTTHHTPGSEAGCVIFVKLWQFDPADRTTVRLDTTAMDYAPVDKRPGVEALTLFQDDHETVRIERWTPSARVGLDYASGAEFMVLDGAFEEGGQTFDAWSWLRLPPGSRSEAVAGSHGCRVWTKCYR